MAELARRGHQLGVKNDKSRSHTLVTVQISDASALATNWETSRVEGALESSRAVGSEVNGAGSDGASGGVVDPHGQIVPIDEGD